jgi:hypothetical protein
MGIVFEVRGMSPNLGNKPSDGGEYGKFKA